MNNTYVLIMAGGKGARLWPKSKVGLPKQMLCFNSDFSLLQDTFARAKNFVSPEHILVVTTEKQAGLVKRQIPYLRKNNLVIEPCGRNTLPCILLGTFLIKEKDAEAIMVVLPSDHLIKPVGNFLALLKQAVKFVQEKDVIVTIGIKPTYPATGYGYIKTSNQKPETSNQKVYKVEKFIEKPPLEKAKKFFGTKNFFWNGGIFIFRASKILEDTKKFMPSVYKEFSCLVDVDSKIEFSSVINRIYKNIPAISVDHAILEKSEDIFMIEANFFWCDLGSWESLSYVFDRDKDKNINIGKNILRGTHDSIIINEQNGHLLVALGVNNLTVVHTPEVTLIQDKSQTEGLKELVACLEKNKQYRRYV